jgi:hypothetical protein
MPQLGNWSVLSSSLSHLAEADEQKRMIPSRDTLPETMMLEKVSDIFVWLSITSKLPSRGSTKRESSSRRGPRRVR